MIKLVVTQITTQHVLRLVKSVRQQTVIVPAVDFPAQRLSSLNQTLLPHPHISHQSAAPKVTVQLLLRELCVILNIYDLFFAEFGEQRLRQMSAICWSESHGDPNRARDACLRTGENCNGNYRKPNCVTNEYSVGIFQINLINENCPYLKNQYSTRTTGQPACIITDAAKFQTECVNPKIEFNYNVNRAVQKLRSQGIGAWPATAKKCGYK